MNLSQFKDWATSQGSVANPDGSYPGQCVSLVQQYLSKVFNIPHTPRGDAEDWATNKNVLTYFDVVSDLQAGDILVYNLNDEDGHIEIYLGNNQSLEQNRGLDKKVHVRSLFTKYPYVILRRKGDNMSTTGEVEFNNLFFTQFGDKVQPTEGDRKRWIGKETNTVIREMFADPRREDYQKYIKDLEKALHNNTGGEYEIVKQPVYIKKK